MILTKENAHRVTMVRKIDAPDSTPVRFQFRGQHSPGIGNFRHLIGDGGQARVIAPAEFGEWEVVETKHPGYLEEFWNAAYSSHSWRSFSPDTLGEDDIMCHEEQLHKDLQAMPEEQRAQYLASYKRHFSEMLSAGSRCASPAVTGSSGFNYRRNEKASNAYDNKCREFQAWRERALKSVERYKESQKSEEQRMDEAWAAVRADIDRTAATIRSIDTGKARGYNRSLFVSGLYGRLSTQAAHGRVEIVDKAVALIREWNAKSGKPVVTERHKLFKLPEVARAARAKTEETAEKENKEVAFEGGTVVWNYAEDRLQILFDEVPESEMRTALKHNAFKWAPRNKAWQRQLTRNAEYAAGKVLKIDI